MIEWLAFPAALALAAAMPKNKANDKRKINTIFKHVGYGVKGKDGKLIVPRYKTKEAILDGENTIGTTYKYTIPLGLPATKMAKMEKDIRVFTDGLQKPVEVEFKRTLNINVYNEELPTMFPYAELPLADEWKVPLGRSVRGLIWHNFDHTPHMTIAGTTRFGKTVMLRMMMTYLIESHPEDVEFFIIDLKGGLEFGRYERIRQVKGVASDPAEALAMLQGIHEQGQKDYVLFRENYYANVVDTPIKKRRFIIVDEAAQLAPEKWMKKEMKDVLGMCQFYLGEIARVFGALGYRELFCTQYPTSDTLPRSIKQNSDAKVSFRLPSGYASGVAIDDYGAEELPSDVKGRALFKTHELKEMQVPFISHEEMWERLERYQKPALMEGEAENVIGTQSGEHLGDQFGAQERTHSEREETPTPGAYPIEFGEAKIRH